MNASLTSKWNYPTTVWVGPGRIKELSKACGETGIRRPLLVTDSGLATHDIVQAMLADLRKAAPAGRLFSRVKSNPIETNVIEGVEAFRAGGHDGVVAIGGGSGLDAGKAIALMVGQQRPLWDFEDIDDWWMRANADGIAPVVAVPTTAGTGSEVGRAAVITRETTHEKKIIFHPKMMPALVILDPELTIGLPPKITAATGIDAFGHCFEAFFAPGFHPLADGIALHGMGLAKRFLPRAYSTGTDLDARSQMLAVASMGATAFQKGLGGVHGLAHAIGALHDAHHGLIVGILLPYVLAFNAPSISDRISQLAVFLDLPDRSASGLLEWLLAFRKDLNIPHTLAEAGIQNQDGVRISELAVADPSTLGNPRAIQAADYARIFQAAYVGNLSSGS
jgi:alcohol dehydrogenase class IV